MNDGNADKRWERTNVTNLLRNGQSGVYYGRVKVNGKEKWKSLKTSVFSVAKLRLSDFEKQVREQGVMAARESSGAAAETAMGRFLDEFKTRTVSEDGEELKRSSIHRREIACLALEKTWPGIRALDARRITATDCEEWAQRARMDGTGFVAPKAKTVRRGMSASAFNKCLSALRGAFEVARKRGAAYGNPAAEIAPAKIGQKRLQLPSVDQFHAIVRSIATAGARQSIDCADMVRFLAFSGLRLTEATSLRWRHVDTEKNQLAVPGTKTESSFRHVPLFPPLAALLAEIRARRLSLDIPAGPDDPILAVKECKGALRSACAAVGVKTITHHDLRHLFATRCIESGVDIPTVSRWLGHADGGALAMRVYGHLRQEHSNAMAAKVSF